MNNGATSTHEKDRPYLEALEPRLLLSTLGTVDFSGPEIQATDVSVATGPGFVYNNYYGNSWRMLYPGYSGFAAKFWLDSVRAVDMEVTHLSSAGAGAPGGGYSPIDVAANGWLLWDNYDVAESHGGSHGYETDVFTLPAPVLQHGWNEVLFLFEDDPWAHTHYWIQSLQLCYAEPVDEAWADFTNLPDIDLYNFGQLEATDVLPNGSGDALRLVGPGTSYLRTGFWWDADGDVRLDVRHLTSSHMGTGYAPVDFVVNDSDGDPFNETDLLLNDYDVAENHGGSHVLETDTFWISDSMLRLGWNSLTIAYEDAATPPMPTTHYWINRLHMRFGEDAPEPEPQFPDLAIYSRDITLVPEGFQQRVNVTVRNIGDIAADNVLLRLRELESGIEGSTTIPSIPSRESVDVSTFLWDPSTPGAHIEAKVDPFDEIEELTNSNNQAVAQYDPTGAAPIVTMVVAEWDGDGGSHRFGRYVSDISLVNTFGAGVIDPNGASNIDYVAFTLGSLGAQTDSNPSDGWTAAFDMGDLSGDATLSVVAYDEQGNASDPWAGTVHMVDFPSWLGTPGTDDYFDQGWYYFGGLFPEFMEQWFTMPTDMYGIPIPIIGGTRSGFRAGIESSVIASLSTSLDPYCSVEFVAYAEVFGQTLLDVRYPPEYHSGYFSLNVSDYDVNRDSLRLEGFDVTAEVTDLPLASFDTPEYPIFGIGIPVLADITLRASAGIEADLDAGLTLHFDGSGIGVSEAWLGLDITGRGTLIGAGRVLGFDLARAEGSLELTLSPELRYVGGTWQPDLSGRMRLPWRVQAGVCPWLCYCPEGYIPDETGWLFSWSDMLGGAAAVPAPLQAAGGEADSPQVFPVLAGDRDAAGNAIIVRTLDGDPAPDTTNSDIYYTYRPSGGDWTTLAPLVESPQMLTTPVVAMDGQGGAVAVWVANDLPNDGSVVNPGMSELFKHQDLYGAYFDGSSWSAPVRITNDAYADGQPALACDPVTGNALLLWTRSEQADATDRSGFEIAYVVWDHNSLSWGSPALLTGNASGDWSPQIAFNGNSQAMAVWTHDTDGSLAGRGQAYALWEADVWSTPAASFVAAGASEGSVVAAPDGSFLVACVREAGAHEQLLTAILDPASGLWRPPELIAEGAIIQEPRLAVNDAGIATLAWQTVGGDGQSDLTAATRDLAGGGAWASAGLLTDSPEIEWMPIIMFDDAGDAQYAHELLGAVGGFALGAGADDLPGLGAGVDVAETELLPDLAVDRVYFTRAELAEGDEVRLNVDVHNAGWLEAEVTEVHFYLGDPNHGGTQLGGAIPVATLAPGAAVTNLMSDLFALPPGVNEYYAVVTPVARETVASNNTDFTVQESGAPDVSGPLADVELLPGSILPQGVEVVVLTFDEPVAGLAESDLSLVEDQLGAIAPDHVLLDQDAMSVHVIFEGGLVDGSYTFKVLDKVTDLHGNALDGDNDGSPGGDFVAAFTVQNVIPQLGLLLVDAPTAALTQTTLPEQAELHILEDHSFYGEVWVRSNPTSPSDIHGGGVDLSFDPAYGQILSVEPVNANWTDGDNGAIDNVTGTLTGVSRSTTSPSAGDDEWVLFARIEFSGNAPVDEIAHAFGPYDLDVGLTPGEFELSYGSHQAEVATANDAQIYSVVYDVDDSGRVLGGDFSYFADAYRGYVGAPEPPYCTWADFDGSGRVMGGDLGWFSGAYRKYTHELDFSHLPERYRPAGWTTGASVRVPVGGEVAAAEAFGLAGDGVPVVGRLSILAPRLQMTVATVPSRPVPGDAAKLSNDPAPGGRAGVNEAISATPARRRTLAGRNAIRMPPEPSTSASTRASMGGLETVDVLEPASGGISTAEAGASIGWSPPPRQAVHGVEQRGVVYSSASKNGATVHGLRTSGLEDELIDVLELPALAVALGN